MLPVGDVTMDCRNVTGNAAAAAAIINRLLFSPCIVPSDVVKQLSGKLVKSVTSRCQILRLKCT